MIAGVVGLWDQAGKGKWSLTPTVIRVITGVRDEVRGGWAWSYEDLPGFAGRLQIDPQGRPAFLGNVLRDAVDVRAVRADGSEDRLVISRIPRAWQHGRPLEASISPDGKYVAAFDLAGKVSFAPLDGGPTQRVDLSLDRRRDTIIGWADIAAPTLLFSKSVGDPRSESSSDQVRALDLISGNDRLVVQVPPDVAGSSIDPVPGRTQKPRSPL